MAKIKDREDLEKWLERKPREFAEVLAARVALRALPLIDGNYPIGTVRSVQSLPMLLPTLRCLAVGIAAAQWPKSRKILQRSGRLAAMKLDDLNVRSSRRLPSSYAAAEASRMVDSAAFLSNAISAAQASASAISYADPDASVYARAATSAAAEFAEALYSVAGINIWMSMEADVAAIEGGISLQKLAQEKLWNRDGWPRAVPDGIGHVWFNLKIDLRDLGGDWDVWIDWYEDRLAGKRPRWKDIDIFRVTLNEEADWEKGPAYVNALIKAKIAEAEQNYKIRRSIKGRPQDDIAFLDHMAATIDDMLIPTNQSTNLSPDELTSPSNNRLATDSKTSNRKRVSKPKTPTGKSAYANRHMIHAQINSVRWFIDDRITRIKADWTVNDRSAIVAEIEELEKWKALLDDVKYAVITLDTTGEEQEIETVVGELRKALITFLKSNGAAAIDLGFRSAIFSTAMVAGALCGIALPAALISGVMVGGKPVAHMIGEVWGGAKSPTQKFKRKKSPEA